MNRGCTFRRTTTEHAEGSCELCGQQLNFRYNPNFLTAEVEGRIADTSQTFRALAQMIADNLSWWDMLIPATDPEGRMTDVQGNVVDSEDNPALAWVPAPISYEWIAANLGHRELMAIQEGMFAGISPNRRMPSSLPSGSGMPVAADTAQTGTHQ